MSLDAWVETDAHPPCTAGVLDARPDVSATVVAAVLAILLVLFGASGCSAQSGGAPAPAVDGSSRVRVSVCIVTTNGPAWTSATFRPVQGDTVVATSNGDVPWREYFLSTGEYAQGKEWFDGSKPIMLPTRNGTLHGGVGSRVVRPFRKSRTAFLTPDWLGEAGTALERVGTRGGVALFAEVGEPRPPQVYYVPIRPGCEFQLLVPASPVDEVGTTVAPGKA
jgi:hypothetical protein